MIKKLIVLTVTSLLIAILSYSYADNIAVTKHNLSASGSGPTKANNESEICVFCHTPHAAQNDVPLWNRRFNNGTAAYTTYSSGSLDAVILQPTGHSKLCLSCHDGSIAIGEIVNSPGSGYGSGITITGASPDGTMRYGLNNLSAEQYSGDTRRLGTNLSNDHPISFVFDPDVYTKDKELVNPYDIGYGTTGNPIKKSTKPVALYPLNFIGPNEAVQCTSCHNPHGENFTDKSDSETTINDMYPKFLRTNLYNNMPKASQEQICLSCHVKTGWKDSTHEKSTLTYRNNVPGVLPAFDGLTVSQHGCLNCHDAHTMQGSDRLHRNGASNSDGTGTPSIENTCFQCHISSSQKVPVVNNGIEDRFISNIPKDKEIKPEFDKFNPLTGGSAMPLSSNWYFYPQTNMSNGAHEPAFVSDLTVNKESVLLDPNDAAKFTIPGPANTHVECVDCHNPHQVIRGTNIPGDGNGGRLKGMPGIDINGNEVGPYTNNDRNIYIMEVCFRCHGDTFNSFIPVRLASEHQGLPAMPANNPLRSTFDLTTRRPGTPASQFTTGSNKRREFNPNSISTNPNPLHNPSTTNNTAFHPVALAGRNRTKALCRQLKPVFDKTSGWDCDTTTGADSALGGVTINCTDCHNNDETGNILGNGKKGPVTETNLRITDVPSDFNADMPVGPHGSVYPRLLRANYNTTLGIYKPVCTYNVVDDYTWESITYTQPCWDKPFLSYDRNNFALCFLCHDETAFNTPRFDDGKHKTNFYSMTFESWGYRYANLHMIHLGGVGNLTSGTNTTCANCHYNVHSNVEAVNTIYKNAIGTHVVPDDNATHLINFSPIVGPEYNAEKYDGFKSPAWGKMNWFGWSMGCGVRCHDGAMNTYMFYTPPQF